MIKATYRFVGDTVTRDWEDLNGFRSHYNYSKISGDFVFEVSENHNLIIPADRLVNVEIEEE